MISIILLYNFNSYRNKFNIYVCLCINANINTKKSGGTVGYQQNLTKVLSVGSGL